MKSTGPNIDNVGTMWWGHVWTTPDSQYVGKASQITFLSSASLTESTSGRKSLSVSLFEGQECCKCSCWVTGTRGTGHRAPTGSSGKRDGYWHSICFLFLLPLFSLGPPPMGVCHPIQGRSSYINETSLEIPSQTHSEVCLLSNFTSRRVGSLVDKPSDQIQPEILLLLHP